MTNIIKTLETASIKLNAKIKDNAAEIAVMAEKYYAAKDEMKSDDFREWASQNDFGFMFDETSEKTGKKIMSQHSKNVSQGIMAIGENSILFLEWADTEHGKNTTSFAKMKTTLNSYEKSLAPKTETESDETETDGDETETQETIQNAPASLEDIARKLVAELGNDNALELSTLIYDIACDGASEKAIAAVS